MCSLISYIICRNFPVSFLHKFPPQLHTHGIRMEMNLQGRDSESNGKIFSASGNKSKKAGIFEFSSRKIKMFFISCSRAQEGIPLPTPFKIRACPSLHSPFNTSEKFQIPHLFSLKIPCTFPQTTSFSLFLARLPSLSLMKRSSEGFSHE